MMKTRTTYIYGLKDPRNNQIHYIGKSNDPKYRFVQHLEDITRNPRKVAWISELKVAGLMPELVILDQVPLKVWQDAERQWIADGHDWGWPLLNMTKGGDGATDGGGIAPMFEALKSFLSPTAWEQFTRLDRETCRKICQLTAMAGMRYCWSAIRALGGNPEREYNQDAQYVAGSTVANQLVKYSTQPAKFAALVKAIEDEGTMVSTKMHEWITLYGKSSYEPHQTIYSS